MQVDTVNTEVDGSNSGLETVQDDTTVDADNLKALGTAVLETEANAIRQLQQRIDSAFVEACTILLQCTGRIVVSGMGKSGHIGSKIAATLASTGSPAFFVHPGEASHGDLGMVRPNDVFIAISNSGNSEELLTIIPIIKRLGVPLIALCGNQNSALARAASVTLDISVEKEACPLGLAPTASTTATLAMGDALAIALLGQRGFSEDDFALSHPGGSLGRKLLLRVSDIMVTGDAIPTVRPHALLPTAVIEISAGSLGFVLVTDEQNTLLGVFTDGDLRRAFDRSIDIRHIRISELMTLNWQSTTADSLAVSAVATMQEHKISALPVLDGKRVCGALNMHALLNAGVV